MYKCKPDCIKFKKVIYLYRGLNYKSRKWVLYANNLEIKSMKTSLKSLSIVREFSIPIVTVVNC